MRKLRSIGFTTNSFVNTVAAKNLPIDIPKFLTLTTSLHFYYSESLPMMLFNIMTCNGPNKDH